MILEFFKKLIKIKWIILVYVLLVMYIMTWSPKEYNKSFNGLYYRLSGSSVKKGYTVTLKGKWKDPLFAHDRFKGKIILDGKEYNTFELKFDSLNGTYISGITNSGKSYTLGKIYFNESYDNFTITLYEKVGINSYSWDSEDGLMFTSGVNNRSEAIKIANEHIKEIELK